MTENTLIKDNHALILNENQIKTHQEFKFSEKDQQIQNLKKDFFGQVFMNSEAFLQLNHSDTSIYLTGDISDTYSKVLKYAHNRTVLVIKELSFNFPEDPKYTLITLGQVPHNVYNVGVFYPNYFQNTKNYFRLLNNEHQFQDLTESDKVGVSYRKGIYLTKVEESKEGLKFKLLRCSTNLKGPTDNLRKTDLEILEQVNQTARTLFKEESELNHVLAQVYNNTRINDKEKKAKIKDHSDKTKDMPSNGLMAFCTFYSNYNENRFTQGDLKGKLKRSKTTPYDWTYSCGSVLTRLRFRLKKVVNDPELEKQFDIVLYPNSVFFMSLKTNRLYTHEIIPATLPVEYLPTRLGYVIRCSDTPALFKDGQTYLVEDNGDLVKLEKPTPEDAKQLRHDYYKENISIEKMDYGQVNFSFNDGDYEQPLI